MAGRLKYLLWLVAPAMLLPLLGGVTAAHAHSHAHVNLHAEKSVPHDGVTHENARHSIAHVPCHPTASTASKHNTQPATQSASHHGYVPSRRNELRETTHDHDGRDTAQGTSVRASTPFHPCPNCWLDCKCAGGCASVSASFGLYAEGGILEFAGFGEALPPLSAAALRSWLTRPSPPPPRV